MAQYIERGSVHRGPQRVVQRGMRWRSGVQGIKRGGVHRGPRPTAALSAAASTAVDC